jgi:dimethylglycine dehydrogenase
MSDHYRVAIIGGGIVGVATAYHLARRGESDVVIAERAELTSGSTWHAAGNLPHFAGSYNMMKLHKDSKDLYRELEARHGDIGMHLTGSLRLAHSSGRMDEFHRMAALAGQAGVDFTVMTPDEIAARFPWLQLHDLKGGLWDPLDGDIDPTSVTNAMARDARELGVTIRRNAPVTSIKHMESGRWQMETPAGAISAEIIVNAAGFRALEVAAMVGHAVPIASMEHQYLVTEDIPELVARSDAIAMIRDPDTSYYLRPERGGIIIGPYEHDGRLWAVDGVPESFGQELLPPDLDRIADHVADALERVPLAAEAGIKTIINGPITYTPDGLPLIGPVAGIDNCFLNCGSSFGITQGGGSGKIAAEWILDGHTSLDMIELDPRRFDDFATPEWVAARCKDIYDNEYAIGYPNEYAMRSAGRPTRTMPAHARHQSAGAQFYSAFGWERPAWFAADGEASEVFLFRRTNAFDAIARECRAVREAAGLLDLSPFSKFDVTGPGAEAFLDGIGGNRMPRRTGGIVLTHALTPDGGILSEFTVTRLGPDHFYLVSAAAAEVHDGDLLRKSLPGDGSVRITNITHDFGTLVLAGPSARDILGQLTSADLTSQAFPWLTSQEIEVAGVGVRALRVNFVGELGWELHHPVAGQLTIYDALMQAGAAHGLTPFGMRAMDSLRLEKMYRGWRTDLTTEYSLVEAGMQRFVRFDKNVDFTGREALMDQAANGAPHALVCLEIDAGNADAIALEPVFGEDGDWIGSVATGGYAHCLGKSLALAYVKSDKAVPGAAVAVELLGERRPAVIHTEPLYDPGNERLRA